LLIKVNTAREPTAFAEPRPKEAVLTLWLRKIAQPDMR
jgi:hypothetical protein